jgi:hypothetical protein
MPDVVCRPTVDAKFAKKFGRVARTKIFQPVQWADIVSSSQCPVDGRADLQGI